MKKKNQFLFIPFLISRAWENTSVCYLAFFFFLPMSGTLMLYQPSLFFETGTYYIAQG